MDLIKKTQTERIKSQGDTKKSVTLAMALFAVLVGVDILASRTELHNNTILYAAKAIITLLIVLVLGKTLKGSSEEAEPVGPSQLVKDNFDVRAITTLIATPDEVLSALTEPLLRSQWDTQLSSAQKQGENVIVLDYISPSGAKYNEKV